jgi:uncharacterized protein
MTACWFDLGVTDVDAAASFYSSLFGWTVAEPDATGYRLISLNGHLVAALGPADDPGPPYWTVYLHTSDIEASMAAVLAAGGTIVVPPTPAGAAGVAAVVRDPDGGPTSFWQPGNHRGTHGAFAAVQVRTDAAAAFLRAVAGWEPPIGPGSGSSSPWLVSFHVTDVAATVAKAVELGASVVSSTVLRDPAGAVFGVSERLATLPEGPG